MRAFVLLKLARGYNLMGPLVYRHQLAYALVIWAAAINFELGAMAILWCRSVELVCFIQIGE